jgi:hypothetical protein
MDMKPLLMVIEKCLTTAVATDHGIFRAKKNPSPILSWDAK